MAEAPYLMAPDQTVVKQIVENILIHLDRAARKKEIQILVSQFLILVSCEGKKNVIKWEALGMKMPEHVERSIVLVKVGQQGLA